MIWLGVSAVVVADGSGESCSSPVLPLEDCGEPIVLEERGKYDRYAPSTYDPSHQMYIIITSTFFNRQERAVLIYRLHHCGWTQGPFHQRTISI